MQLFQSAESRYNQWAREHYRFLFRSASALTGSRAVAEDVAQVCFTNAWTHRGQLRDPELARAWLFQIMRRDAFRQMAPGMQLREAVLIDPVDRQTARDLALIARFRST